MIRFFTAFFASKKNVWSVDWNSHFGYLPLNMIMTKLKRLKHYELIIWFLNFLFQRQVLNIAALFCSSERGMTTQG